MEWKETYQGLYFYVPVFVCVRNDANGGSVCNNKN